MNEAPLIIQNYSKIASFDDNLHKTKAFNAEDWKVSQYEKRHGYTRFPVFTIISAKTKNIMKRLTRLSK
jgi:hypothetical protein